MHKQRPQAGCGWGWGQRAAWGGDPLPAPSAPPHEAWAPPLPARPPCSPSSLTQASLRSRGDPRSWRSVWGGEGSPRAAPHPSGTPARPPGGAPARPEGTHRLPAAVPPSAARGIPASAAAAVPNCLGPAPTPSPRRKQPSAFGRTEAERVALEGGGNGTRPSASGNGRTYSRGTDRLAWLQPRTSGKNRTASSPAAGRTWPPEARMGMLASGTSWSRLWELGAWPARRGPKSSGNTRTRSGPGTSKWSNGTAQENGVEKTLDQKERSG